MDAAQLVTTGAPALARTTVRPALHLTRRGRVVVALLVLTLTVLVVAVSWGQASGATATRGAVTYETVTVQPGQSLWEIARAAAPSADTRSTISRIVDLNDLPESGAVRAGQQLTVPATR